MHMIDFMVGWHCATQLGVITSKAQHCLTIHNCLAKHCVQSIGGRMATGWALIICTTSESTLTRLSIRTFMISACWMATSAMDNNAAYSTPRVCAHNLMMYQAQPWPTMISESQPCPLPLLGRQDTQEYNYPCWDQQIATSKDVKLNALLEQLANNLNILQIHRHH